MIALRDPLPDNAMVCGVALVLVPQIWTLEGWVLGLITPFPEKLRLDSA